VDTVKFSDLEQILTKAKASAALNECEEYLTYFQRFSQKVIEGGSRVPDKYQDIQAELSSKILNHSDKNASDDWYKKPKGIIILAVTSGIILLIIRQIVFTP
jgi:hypothetical protein